MKVTDSPSIIESCFRLFLRHITSAQSLKYVASGFASSQIEVFGASYSGSQNKGLPVLQVLTPLFYSQLADCNDVSALISRNMADEPSSRTVHVHPAETVINMTKSLQSSVGCRRRESPLTRFRWTLLSWLRTKRNPPSLDEFVRWQVNGPLASEYRRAVMVLLLSKWIAFGFPEILDAACYAVQAVVCYLSIDTIWHAMKECMEGETLGGNDLRGSFIGALHLLLIIAHTLFQRHETVAC